jgi:hypothetical protein
MMARSFPKTARFTIGQRCESRILKLLELLYAANASRGNERSRFLARADLSHNMLKMLVRLAYDVMALDQKRYLSLQTDLQEIGRMLGGWIKASRHGDGENPAA